MMDMPLGALGVLGRRALVHRTLGLGGPVGGDWRPVSASGGDANREQGARSGHNGASAGTGELDHDCSFLSGTWLRANAAGPY